MIGNKEWLRAPDNGRAKYSGWRQVANRRMAGSGEGLQPSARISELNIFR